MAIQRFMTNHEGSDSVPGKFSVLIVGNYCHDTLRLGGGREVQALGGSAAYIAKLLAALQVSVTVVAKVGPDFRYHDRVLSSPIIDQLSSTTEFVSLLQTDGERRLTAGNVCSPVLPTELPELPDGELYDVGLAVGVAGEILPDTLQRLVQLCRDTVVDLQALIRNVWPHEKVALRRLEDTPFASLLPSISYLKASLYEAQFIDIPKCVQQCKVVIITDGPHGSTLYTRPKELKVAAFPAEEVDPTGAGDTFLAGFVAGLSQGLGLESAARMGNYFGSLAVSQIGIPSIDRAHIDVCNKLLQQAGST